MLDTAFHQQGNYGKAAVVGAMYQMRRHVVTLAVNSHFRGTVEMDVFQIIGFSCERETAVTDGNGNGMAVIDNPECRGAVIETDKLPGQP